MYVVVLKSNPDTIVHINHAPLSQNLSGTAIYSKYDASKHLIGMIDTDLPENWTIGDDGMIRELTTQEKFDRGILILTPEQKISNGEIVTKTTEEQAADGVITTEDFRSIVLARIDSRTKALIAEGFTFDDVVFSLSEAAQSNWTALNLLYSRSITEPNTVEWPAEGIAIPTKAGGKYILQKDKANAFFGAAFPITTGRVASGLTLKERVASISTTVELLAFTDPR